MPERPKGRDPNRRPSEQREQSPLLPEYRRAVRFPNEQTSSTAFVDARQAIYETPCDLSVFRTVLLPDVLWHLLVLGRTPEPALLQRIDHALREGQPVELPDDIWKVFNLRRLESNAQGPWVERRTPRRRNN